MIKIELLSETNFCLESLDSYNRKQDVNKVYRRIDGEYALVECKDYSGAKINIEPLAKMRNQLARRHSSVFGMFFSATDYTVPAEILVSYMAPQLIVLWTKMDIEFCLKNSCFIPCMKEKYRRAVENCEYNYAFYLEHTEFEKLPSDPLF